MEIGLIDVTMQDNAADELCNLRNIKDSLEVKLKQYIIKLNCNATECIL